MKINRLSARVIAVFAAVLLITALSIPTFAATSYFFQPDDSGVCTYNGSIPDGNYLVSYCYSHSDGEISELSSSSPASFSFEWDENSQAYISLASISFDTLNGNYIPPTIGDFAVAYDTSGVSICALISEGEPYQPLSATLTFVEPEIPSLSDLIPADTLPNVFNEIISLLPIALGVIVGYIAIRKGISYLQSFLHNS